MAQYFTKLPLWGALALVLAVSACASQQQTEKASMDSSTALQTAQSAEKKAADAMASSDAAMREIKRLQQEIQRLNEKMDRMFQKSMMK